MKSQRRPKQLGLVACLLACGLGAALAGFPTGRLAAFGQEEKHKNRETEREKQNNKKKGADSDVEFFRTFEAALGRIEEREKRAAALCEQIAKDPQNAMLHAQLADVLAGLLRRKESHRVYDQALTLDPHCIAARRGKGRVYHDQEEFGRARRQFSEALRIDPHDVKSLEQLIQISHAMGRADEAEQNREKLIKELGAKSIGGDKPVQYCREKFALLEFKMKVIETIDPPAGQAKFVFEAYNKSGYTRLLRVSLLTPGKDETRWRMTIEQNGKTKRIEQYDQTPTYLETRRSAVRTIAAN